MGFDVAIAKELGHERFTDEEHLAWASEHRRAVLTYDRVDFMKLNLGWALSGQPHGGIIVSIAPPEIPYLEVLARLLRLLDAVTADGIANNLIRLDETWTAPRRS